MFTFLSSLFRKPPADVLTNLRVADQWVHTVLREDPYEAMKKIVDALAVTLKFQEPLNKERLKALLYLDENSQRYQKKLGETYFSRQGELKGAADVLGKSMVMLYTHFARAYQMYIREVVNQHGHTEFSRFLPTITARALHYHAQSIKWGYFRHEPIQPAMWKRLHKYYLMCEESDFAHTEVVLNGDNRTTCANEYVQILLLDMIKPLMLPPAQIEMVDHWLDLWSHLVTLERDCDIETHMHCVDLSTGSGARKLLEGMSGAKLRCWSMVDLYLQIRKSRANPDQSELGEDDTQGEEGIAPDCLHLLDYVARYWIRPEAARRQYRSPVEDRMVEMACGVNSIYSCLQPAEQQAAGHKIPFEHWSVQDESEGGYGLVEARPTERAQEGKLVLVKPTGHGTAWEIGVVRWKKDSESGLPALGIERLSDDPKQVELLASDGGKQKVIKAIFLPKFYQRNIDSSLILQTTDYRAGQTLDMKYRHNVIRVRLAEVVDNSDEWVRVQFTVLGNHRQ